MRILHSPEKSSWLVDAVERFHKEKPRLEGRRPIRIALEAVASSNIMNAAMREGDRVHGVFPTSSWQVSEANRVARSEFETEPFREAVSILRTPLVFVTWKRAADRMGWTETGLGWRELGALSADPALFASSDLGMPFHIAFPDPESTITGRMVLLALATVAGGYFRGPTKAMMESSAAQAIIWGFERSVSNYASSPGALMENFIESGPENLALAIVYEHQTELIRRAKGKEPLLVLHPKDGTWVADHPLAVVDRPWVGQAHRDAVTLLRRFLLSDAEQKLVEKAGMRPAARTPQRKPPFLPPEGLDPAEPDLLELQPGLEINQIALDSWREVRRPIRTVILLDLSASMGVSSPRRLDVATALISALIERLPANDQVAFATVSNHLQWRHGMALPSIAVEPIKRFLATTKPEGGGALLDGLREAYRILAGATLSGPPANLIVVSDGGDVLSRTTLAALEREIADRDQALPPIRIHSVALGDLAGWGLLRRIALRSGGRLFQPDPQSPEKTATEILSWF